LRANAEVQDHCDIECKKIFFLVNIVFENWCIINREKNESQKNVKKCQIENVAGLV
jgi:hypothetical protein